jgi:tetratricopeptide (TPR) repeat protein
LSNEMVSIPDPNSLPPRWQAAWRWGAPALALAALILLGLNCLFNSGIRFLTPVPGKWIVYPLPADLRVYPGIELTGTFRRTFVLPDKPAAAVLSWRCLTNSEVVINNRVVARSGSSSGDWKDTSEMEMGQFLRQGTNVIWVSVVNAGPPALSLKLKIDNFSLVTDENWEVSVSGSNWRAAQAASMAPKAGKGNELSLLETTGGALGRCWPFLCLFAALSAGGIALSQYYLGRTKSPASPMALTKIVLITLAGAWALLFLHNFVCLPGAEGFDATSHLEYVRYVEHYKALPSAREGWEMFQPPLYYIISASLLGIGHSEVYHASGMMLLRCLSLAIGVVNLALIFAGLRLIFPDDWKKPLAGVVLAAFLPAHIYLLHYTTNETLSAMLVTASLCLGLQLLRTGQLGWVWHGLLGVVLGLALLSKVSAVLAVAVVLAVLTANLILRRVYLPQTWVDEMGTPLLICLFLGGWHYMILWHDFGSPFTGNWNPKVFVSWWQAKGFQTPAYYLTFGTALVRPFCSGLHSFWDGLYSTLWGDGLLGGHTSLLGRPPWNYNLMAVGYILALVPTALVLTGLVRALILCFRAITLPWVMLMTVGWLFAFAIVNQNLDVASYSVDKAFFGLPALLPFCALGALGFEFWSGRGKVTRYALALAMGIWLLNVYASFWIRPHTVESELAAALSRSSLKEDPADAVLKIVDHHPGNVEATVWLAAAESKTHPEQAVKRLEEILKENPTTAQIESVLAQSLALCDRLDEAIVHARRAVELAPQDPAAFQTLCALALRHKDYHEAVTAGRDALSLNPADLETQLNLGLALMNLRQIPEAISHFSAIVNFQPSRGDAQFNLGRCLLEQPGKRDEGLGHLQEAVRLEPTNTVWEAELKKVSKE